MALSCNKLFRNLMLLLIHFKSSANMTVHSKCILSSMKLKILIVHHLCWNWVHDQTKHICGYLVVVFSCCFLLIISLTSVCPSPFLRRPVVQYSLGRHKMNTFSHSDHAPWRKEKPKRRKRLLSQFVKDVFILQAVKQRYNHLPIC